MQIPKYSYYPFGFFNASENSIMVDDATMSSNPPVAPIEK
jgi:hypothetical protein